MDYEHGLDGVGAIFSQSYVDEVRRNGPPPRGRDLVKGDVQGPGTLSVQGAEVSIGDDEGAVAGGEGVHDRGLPGPGARSGEEEYGPVVGAEYAAEPREDFADQGAELGPTVIDHGLSHRPEDAVRDVRRAGNLQKRTAWHAAALFHEVRPCPCHSFARYRDLVR